MSSQMHNLFQWEIQFFPSNFHWQAGAKHINISKPVILVRNTLVWWSFFCEWCGVCLCERCRACTSKWSPLICMSGASHCSAMGGVIVSVSGVVWCLCERCRACTSKWCTTYLHEWCNTWFCDGIPLFILAYKTCTPAWSWFKYM